MCYPTYPPRKTPGKGAGNVVTRRRVDRVISPSLSPSAQYIYVFAAHALAYHPLSDEGDDATLQMNPITHQGGRPPHSLVARASLSPSPSLPPCGGDFSSGLQWRIGSMDDGRWTPFFAPPPPPTIQPSAPPIPLSCPLIRITPESSMLHPYRKNLMTKEKGAVAKLR